MVGTSNLIVCEKHLLKDINGCEFSIKPNGSSDEWIVRSSPPMSALRGLISASFVADYMQVEHSLDVIRKK